MANFKEIMGFDDRRFMLVGVPLSSLFISLLLFPERWTGREGWGMLTACMLISLIYTVSFWVLLRWSYLKVLLRFPAADQIGKRLSLLLVIFVGIFFLVNGVLDTLLQPILGNDGYEPSLIIEFIGALLLASVVMATYEAVSFYIRLEKTQAEKTELERHYIQSQLEGLRNQVNPHFLFNSLNTLVYLIPENSEKAVSFVRQLSKVYRYVLESRDANLIPLADELEFLQAYIFLQKERFGENFQVKIEQNLLQDQPPINQQTNQPVHQIVPLSLQMLFENAIKHNIISREKPLLVEVFCRDGSLVVRNNLQLKNQVSDSTGVGLANIRERYRMLVGKEVFVEATADFFSVALPVC